MFYVSLNTCEQLNAILKGMQNWTARARSPKMRAIRNFNIKVVA